MSIAEALLVLGSLVFLAVFLALGSWLEARLAHQVPQLVAVPVEAEGRSTDPAT